MSLNSWRNVKALRVCVSSTERPSCTLECNQEILIGKLIHHTQTEGLLEKGANFVWLNDVYRKVGHWGAWSRVKGPVNYVVITMTVDDEIFRLNHGHGNL